MKRLTWVLFTLISFILIELFTTNAPANPPRKISEEELAPISKSVEQAIRVHQIPGAVILIANQGKVVYRRAFGHRALEPKKFPMTLDTLFDIASLTKVVGTTTALLQLVEDNKANLDDPVAKYWPEFKENGKAEVTLQRSSNPLFRFEAGSGSEALVVWLQSGTQKDRGRKTDLSSGNTFRLQ